MSLLLIALALLYWLSTRPRENRSSLPPEPPETDAQVVWNRIQEFWEIITHWAEFYEINPMLVAAIIWQESSGLPNVIGDNGTSFGLMQITRGAAEDMGYLHPTQEKLLDPETNIQIGIGYLDSMFQRFKTWDLAIIAYNAGPGNVDQGNYTRAYLDSVYNYQWALNQLIDTPHA